MKIWEASYITRHFQFVALDLSKDSAIAVLIDGLREHARQYGLADDWWNEGFEGVPTDEIFELREFELGFTYRDNDTQLVTKERLEMMVRDAWSQALEYPHAEPRYKDLKARLEKRK